ncbi:MAG: pantoate--beta-alanine ligase [Pseudobdellovibrionaceae bacterium]
MIILKSLADIQEFKKTTVGPRSLGFVPTMGALHQGHMELLKKAKAENDFSVLSIYVNPTQFNQATDFDNYPQTLDQDLKSAQEVGTTAVFLPSYDLIYPDKYQFRIIAPELTDLMDGQFRPGHFDGVMTVVCKLFRLIEPTKSYFGEKDYQQFLIVKKMAEAFYLKTHVIPVPTVREKSGLAMSSRNTRLSDSGKTKAAAIYKALNDFKSTGEARAFLESRGFKVEYIEEHFSRRFAAAWIEGVRLIDNIPWKGARDQ